MQYEKISEKFKGHRVLLASAHDSATQFGRPQVYESEIIEFSPSLKYFKSKLVSNGSSSWGSVDDDVVIEDLGKIPVQITNLNSDSIKSWSSTYSIAATPISIPTVFWGDHHNYKFTCKNHASS